MRPGRGRCPSSRAAARTRPRLRRRAAVILPEQAAEVSRVEEPHGGQHRHAAWRRDGSSRSRRTASRRSCLIRPPTDQGWSATAVERSGRHVMRRGDAGPGQPGIVQVRAHVPDDVRAHVIGGIGVGQVAVVEQRAGEQGRAASPSLAAAATRMSRLGDGADHEVRQHAPGTMGRRVHPVHPAVRSLAGRPIASRGSAMTAHVHAPSRRIWYGRPVSYTASSPGSRATSWPSCCTVAWPLSCTHTLIRSPGSGAPRWWSAARSGVSRRR